MNSIVPQKVAWIGARKRGLRKFAILTHLAPNLCRLFSGKSFLSLKVRREVVHLRLSASPRRPCHSRYPPYSEMMHDYLLHAFRERRLSRHGTLLFTLKSMMVLPQLPWRCYLSPMLPLHLLFNFTVPPPPPPVPAFTNDSWMEWWAKVREPLVHITWPGNPGKCEAVWNKTCLDNSIRKHYFETWCARCCHTDFAHLSEPRRPRLRVWCDEVTCWRRSCRSVDVIRSSFVTLEELWRWNWDGLRDGTNSCRGAFDTRTLYHPLYFFQVGWGKIFLEWKQSCMQFRVKSRRKS